MASFPDALRDAVKTLYGGVTLDDVPAAARAELAFAKSPKRLAEAAEVAGVAEAFAHAELWPPAGSSGLGIHGPNMIKALGEQLGRKAPKPDSPEAEGALDGIRFALACGYMASLALEADNPQNYRSGEALEKIWSIMVGNFRADGVRVLGWPTPVVDNMEKFGQDAITDALRSVGLLGWRSGRIGLVGRYYAHAGAFMRAAQTDYDFPAKVEVLSDTLASEWPFHRYAQPA